MDWLDLVTAALAIVVAPLALRNFLHQANQAKHQEQAPCDCQSPPSSLPQEQEPPSERQPDSR